VLTPEVIELINSLSEENYEAALKFAKFLLHLQETQASENSARLGTMKGQFTVPDGIDACNDEIAELFGAEE